jgi:hypothetical protein
MHKVYQLRAEFVKNYKLPLSSDAFSRFANQDPDAAKHEAAVAAASAFLMDGAIGNFIRDLETRKIVILTCADLCANLHKRGWFF